MQEIRVQSLGQEELLKKEMATYSSIHAWEIPEKPGGLQSMGLLKGWTRLSDETTTTTVSIVEEVSSFQNRVLSTKQRR